MKKVYIISRFKADNAMDMDFNIDLARYYARIVTFAGDKPVASHLYYTHFLDDFKAKERALGIALGLRDLRECDEFLLVVVDGILSEGMKMEIAEVSRLGIPGRIITMTRREAEEVLRTVV